MDDNEDYQFQPNSGGDPTINIISLVLGVLGIVGGFIPTVRWFTLIFAILAIVFGVSGRRKGGSYVSLATAGLVLGIVGVVLTVLVAICAGIFSATLCSVAGDLLADL